MIHDLNGHRGNTRVMMEDNVETVRKGVFLNGESKGGVDHTGQYADLGSEKPERTGAALLLSANRCFLEEEADVPPGLDAAAIA
jgi:hypothetical protein